MAKKIEKQLKLQVPAGKATPAPPLGPALGQAGINIGEFVNQFNEATRELGNDIIPVVISVYDDRSFDFILKTPPASSLLLKIIGEQKGSGKNTSKKVGKVTQQQLEDIAAVKMEDLSANDIKAGAKIIAGTARSMGIETE
ncbi:50S ribosomal protein L11 [bacterium]|nr:50S ribosomal protein L11 [Parcubacteria group bacterium]MBF05272.1 50S ribosomal protein L11 [bacterium]|tara:strand:- start:2007 stop:2429 length:423 start_codon:yes stop_codon:yes gene_type:complete